MSKRNGTLAQVAALPYRVIGDQVEVLLITSRGKQRWIFPKGWTERGTKPRAMAAREAFEEAGVRGRIGKQPYGFYHYTKRLAGKRLAKCRVAVYLLEVEEELADWPEQAERERRWVASFQAPLYIRSLSLTSMLLHLGFAGKSADALAASRTYSSMGHGLQLLNSVISNVKRSSRASEKI